MVQQFHQDIDNAFIHEQVISQLFDPNAIFFFFFLACLVSCRFRCRGVGFRCYRQGGWFGGYKCRCLGKPKGDEPMTE